MHWRNLFLDKRQRQKSSLPAEWIIKEPSKDVLDVTKIPEQCGLLSEKEIEVTTSSVDIILQKLAFGDWSSVAVTTAFYKRAIIAHQLTNCLTEIFVEQALARAEELDQYLAKTGRAMGPLHGLPISLKDQISMKGLETTMGYVSWIGKYAEADSVLVEVLYQCGAVPFVRTNVPQTLMWPETCNFIFGRTSNPHNRSLTCGGSSGGEGALVALKGSPLGVGSDIGGSVRIPSAFCGTYGLRPSYGRVPYSGCTNSMEGQDSVPSVLGPLSNSLEGIKIFMRAVIGEKPWLKDPLAVRKKWDEEEYKLIDHGHGKQLCFAVIRDDGIVTPHPPIQRGIELTKQALIRAGHRVIEWKPLKHYEIVENLLNIWSAASAEDYFETTKLIGEPILTSMDPEEESFLPDTPSQPVLPGISSYQLWQLQKKKRDLRKEYLDHWEKTLEETGTGRPVDAIISPVVSNVAPPHGKNKAAHYTIVWNALDYPALSIPVSTFDKALDVKHAPHAFLNDEDKAHYEIYDPALYENAPISVQIIARTLEEEALVGMSEVVDAAIKAFNFKA